MVHNHLAELDDDCREAQAVEFFRDVAEVWAEEMADALEKIGYTVTKDE